MTLVQARELIDWNQSDLARESQQSNSTISDLESGDNKNPSYALVMSVVAALQRGGLKNLSPEDIFTIKKKAVA